MTKATENQGEPSGVPRLMTLAEVESLTGRHVRSLWNDVAKGRLQVVRLGGSVRVTEQDYLDYIQRGRS